MTTVRLFKHPIVRSIFDEQHYSVLVNEQPVMDFRGATAHTRATALARRLATALATEINYQHEGR